MAQNLRICLQCSRLDSIPGLGRSPEEENGNSLQYSCLENPMNREAWWATVHEVTKSQTWLSDYHIFSNWLLQKFFLNIVLSACSLKNACCSSSIPSPLFWVLCWTSSYQSDFISTIHASSATEISVFHCLKFVPPFMWLYYVVRSFFSINISQTFRSFFEFSFMLEAFHTVIKHCPLSKWSRKTSEKAMKH